MTEQDGSGRLPGNAWLGPYQLLGLLGAGGMGAVYKARDSRLDRIVAIKVLPERFAEDPTRRERFEREARAVAALNHPHICQLYDVGDAEASPAGAGRQRFLVMEYLEGQSLEDRIVAGPLTIAEALSIATDLAGALDHAHRRGLVHRDLKPANVMLTKAGAGPPQAKLLDFGISRLQAPADLPALETVTEDRAPLTADGAVLGTYPYMAPEQLAGREADARSDIFALGAVIYEMVTAQRAFQGTTAATLIGAILHSDPPPLAGRQPLAPPALERVVSRCLAKDPDNRWQTARDLALELQWIAEHPAASSRAVERRWASAPVLSVAAVLAALAIAAAASSGAFLRAAPEAAPVIRMALAPPDGPASDASSTIGPVIISPDGRHLVYAMRSADGRQQLWVRALDSIEPRPLADTDGGASPFWSPDSRWLGFFALGKLKRIAIDRGPAQILSDAREPRGGTWSTAGEILFTANSGREVYRIPAGGGVPTPLPADGLNLERLQPSFLPDGRHFVYAGRNQKPGVFLGSLDSPDVTLLFADYSAVAPVPGYLLLLRGAAANANIQTLLAQRFDAGSRTAIGSPEPLMNDINFETRLGLGYFSASATGTLIYGNPEWRATRLRWFDRSGEVVGQVDAAGDFSQPALSPDDATIVAQRVDPETGVSDLWSIDTASGLGQRLTHGNFGAMPLWSPDGKRIVFTSARGRFPPNLFLATVSASGDEQRLDESEDLQHPTDWSRDGTLVIFAAQSSGTGWDLMTLPMTGPASGRRPEPLRNTTFNEHFGRLSPDQRWLAYASDESGVFEVYVRPFPGDGAPQRVSIKGGVEPLWRGDGSELYYVAPAGVLMTAAVANTGAATFRAGAPLPVFPTQATPRIARRAQFLPTYRVSKDGKRFLLSVPADDIRTTPTKVMFNWTSALGSR